VNTNDKNVAFNAIIAEALKKMQNTVTTAVSSSYEVHRSSGGELIVQRSDKAWHDSNAVELPLEKKAA